MRYVRRISNRNRRLHHYLHTRPAKVTAAAAADVTAATNGDDIAL